MRLASKFHTKKRLGQNFLIDPDALQSITDALDITDGDSVLEIGPGIGFLTRFLSAKGANLHVVELDWECCINLKDLEIPNVTVHQQDFLQFDIASQPSHLKIAGNVPYQITTPILCYIFGEIGAPAPWFQNVDKVVLTVQKEVAERFVAKPGTSDYSKITLLTNYFSEAEILHVLPPESFYPAPKVTSAVVRFTPLRQPPIECGNHKLLRQVIKAGFGQKRKMLRNNLSFLKQPLSALDKVFREMNLDPQTRAERLSLQQFARLTDLLDALPKEKV
ncbi:MAG: ribosomal RNA small subunit methyltransferase A [Cyanobacteria bacterium SZAS-4]|nr:ribosomal RNA small subunit methyltransferase A [Cyanobacteria bacterium SZAS-4]